MTDSSTLSAADVRRLLDGALRAPAQEGARLVALHWLQQLVAARSAWRAIDDANTNDSSRYAELLHQVRVALRRLRAVLREHERELDDAVDGRTLRALRALGRATSAMRDRDVQRTWLGAETDGLPEPARSEAVHLCARLDTRTTRATDRVTAAFTRHLDPVADRLASRLSSYRLLRRVGAATAAAPFSRHLGARLTRTGDRLRRDLAQIDGVTAHAAMHRVRIRLKRQRAMLAPFAAALPGVAAWFDLATRGQDLLGAIRDADLLAHRARRVGFDALSASVEQVALAHFDAFRMSWCDQVDAVLRTLDAAANELRDLTTPVNAEGVPMEIERKFLLSACPPVALGVAPLRIEQGWLPGTTLRERLRRTTRPTGDVQLLRTIKLGPAAARLEIEEATTPALFEKLWPLTADARVRKQRHKVRDGEHTWEIDVFLDRDLVLAEVELSAIDERATPPAWLQPFIVRDVTGEPEYFNAVLARPDHE